MSFTLQLLVGQREYRADARAHATFTSCWEREVGKADTTLRGRKGKKEWEVDRFLH